MQKKSLFIVIGIVLLFLVGGGFLVINKKTSPDGNSLFPQKQTGLQESGNKSTLKDLLAKGIAQKCTFSDKMEGVDSSGIMYISGNKMRGDFDSVVEGKTMASHMIFENNTAYNWSDGQKTGMMFKMDPNEAKDAQNEVKQNQQFDPNKVIDYKCSAWIVDNSLFVPPSDVKFSDLSSVMAPTGVNTTGQGTFNMCAACNNLTGDEKQQCLTALKCS